MTIFNLVQSLQYFITIKVGYNLFPNELKIQVLKLTIIYCFNKALQHV